MSTVDFQLPSLGADMDVGTVLEWHVGVGDTVRRGDVVALVKTEKADIDIEVWDTGEIQEIVTPVGVEVPVGTVLARIETTEERGARLAPPRPPVPAVEAPPTVTAPVEPAAPAPSVEEREPAILPPRAPPVTRPGLVPASPLARRLAGERGIDLSAVAGSGPGGAVTARDLEAPPPPAPAAAPPEAPAAAMRRAIAKLMARSKREIPHYYLQLDIDLEAALGWLEGVNAERPVADRILPAALFMKALATSAAQHPPMNGFWQNDAFRPSERVHLGVGVSLRGGGLIAPALHDADRLGVEELMVALRDLVGRARAGRLRGSEMSDPTITVTNLGDRGVNVVHGVIYPPQVALVGFGRVSSRPAVVDGVVVARRQVSATLAADHRASDGQVGARFLNTIDRLLQKPEAL